MQTCIFSCLVHSGLLNKTFCYESFGHIGHEHHFYSRATDTLRRLSESELDYVRVLHHKALSGINRCLQL